MGQALKMSGEQLSSFKQIIIMMIIKSGQSPPKGLHVSYPIYL